MYLIILKITFPKKFFYKYERLTLFSNWAEILKQIIQIYNELKKICKRIY